jgi:hypothetical protein
VFSKIAGLFGSRPIFLAYFSLRKKGGDLMKRLWTMVGVVALNLALGNVSGASLMNPGFETGDFTGWTVNSTDLTYVTTEASTFDNTSFTAREGQYFAVATAGLGADTPTVISQTVYLNAGEKVVGSALFDCRDYLRTEGDPVWMYNDYAFVAVNGDHNSVWDVYRGNVGNYGHTNWETWYFTAPSNGDYLFQYGVVNVGDNSNSSRAFFDAQVVPIPGAVWLLGSGLLGLAGWRRFRKG